MENNNKNVRNKKLEELSLTELIQVLIINKSKIFTISLIIAIASYVFAYQKDEIYKSNAVIEVGSYGSNDSSHVLIESTKELIRDLKIRFIHKRNTEIDAPNQINIVSLEDKLIKLTYSSLTANQNDKILNEIIDYISEKHIKAFNNEILLRKSELNSELDRVNRIIMHENEKNTDAINLIKGNIAEIDETIKFNEILLNTNISSEASKDSLGFNDLIQIQKTINDNQLKKIELLRNLKNLENSNTLFNNNESKIITLGKLEELDNINIKETQLIGQIKTTIQKPPKLKITFLGFLGGLLFGISVVLVNYSTTDRSINMKEL